jgi:hypothetical protein
MEEHLNNLNKVVASREKMIGNIISKNHTPTSDSEYDKLEKRYGRMSYLKLAKLDLLDNTLKKGVRVRIIEMKDSQSVKSGTEGVIRKIDDIGQIHVNWDNGSSLAIIPGEDTFEII